MTDTKLITRADADSFEKFIPLALRTESQPPALRTNARAFVAAISAAIATAEILDGFKKQLFYGKSEKLTAKLAHFNGILQDATIILSEGVTADSLTDSISMNPRVLHGLLGFVTEAGELAAVLNKGVAGETIDAVNIQEEVSDAAWYVAIINDELKLDYYTGLTNVVNKLIVRYPDKFSSYFADNRDLDAERKQLEQNVNGVVMIDATIPDPYKGRV